MAGISDIFNVMSGGMNLAGGAANLANTGLGLWQYFQRQNDPLFRAVEQLYVDRINQGANPFGNPFTGAGGAYGNDAQGNPMSYGDFATRAHLDMMQNQMAQSQAAAGAAGNLAMMQRPGGHGQSIPAMPNVSQAMQSPVMQQVNTAPPQGPSPSAQLPNRPPQGHGTDDALRLLEALRPPAPQQPQQPTYQGSPPYAPPGQPGRIPQWQGPQPAPYRPTPQVPQGLGLMGRIRQGSR